MNSNYEKVLSALTEIRTECKACPHTDFGIKALINKYDMVFAGKNINKILTIELCHCLASKFGIQIEIDELNQMTPTLCKTLSMEFEPLANASDLSNPIPTAYYITLE